MGLIAVAKATISGALSEQWMEMIEPAEMDNSVVSSYGVMVQRNDSRNKNRKGTEDVITNGSIIHVPENTYMLLVDGGKIISATNEAGYYQVDNSRSPSLFFRTEEKQLQGYNNTGQQSIERPGGIVNTLKDSWERFKFGGATPLKQQVIYINQQEIPNFRFGTKKPVLFADRGTLNGVLLTAKVTSFGTYSLKIADPILFYREVCQKIGKQTMKTEDMAEQYINEFLMAYQTALSNLAKEGISVVEIQTRTMEVGEYMADVLDQKWLTGRGFYILSVGIASISLDQKTEEVLDSMNKDSLLLNAERRAARMTRGVSAGIENAGKNEGGSMMGFAGVGMGMNMSSNTGIGQVMNPATTQPTNPSVAQSINQPNAGQVAGTVAAIWYCTECGHQSSGKFCPECGTKRPQSVSYRCNKCGFIPAEPNNPPKFCPECGDPFTPADRI